MSTSNSNRLFRFVATGSFLGLLTVAGGCGEVMTDTRGNDRTATQLYNDGNYSQDVGATRANIARNPADYVSHYYLAASLEKTGAHEEAIEQFKTTLAVMSNSLVGREDHDFRMKVLDSLATAIVNGKDREAESAALMKGTPSAENQFLLAKICLLYTSPSPRDRQKSRMPSSA